MGANSPRQPTISIRGPEEDDQYADADDDEDDREQ
jgi:hypothetical protein